MRATEASPDTGVSYGYTLLDGWRPSYRETSGYIAVTFYDLAKRFEGSGFQALAESVSRWLLTIQEADGSIANPRYRPGHGIVFDTGQVLLGYTRALAETEDDAFRVAGERACEWLARRVDDDGAWRTNTHLDHPHTYNSRVAWAMLAFEALVPNPATRAAATKNLEWALTQEVAGYFETCAFKPGVAPFTHTIAYAIRGLLEGGLLLDDNRFIDSAIRGADAMLGHVRRDGFIPGQVDTRGRPAARYCCLTGNCQLAIIWFKLFKRTEDGRYLDAAKRSLRYVMQQQDLETSNPAIRGAIKGSQPIWGRYAPLSYPNWATKFFVDALLLWEEVEA